MWNTWTESPGASQNIHGFRISKIGEHQNHPSLPAFQITDGWNLKKSSLPRMFVPLSCRGQPNTLVLQESMKKHIYDNTWFHNRSHGKLGEFIYNMFHLSQEFQTKNAAIPNQLLILQHMFATLWWPQALPHGYHHSSFKSPAIDVPSCGHFISHAATGMTEAHTAQHAQRWGLGMQVRPRLTVRCRGKLNMFLVWKWGIIVSPSNDTDKTDGMAFGGTLFSDKHISSHVDLLQNTNVFPAVVMSHHESSFWVRMTSRPAETRPQSPAGMIKLPLLLVSNFSSQAPLSCSPQKQSLAKRPT